MSGQIDYAKRLAEIEARHNDDAHDVHHMLRSEAHEARGWLLSQVHAASDALNALGIPDDGRSLAERIGDLRRQRVEMAMAGTADLADAIEKIEAHHMSYAVHSSYSARERSIAISEVLDILDGKSTPAVERIKERERRAAEQLKRERERGREEGRAESVAPKRPTEEDEPQAGGLGMSMDEAMDRYGTPALRTFIESIRLMRATGDDAAAWKAFGAYMHSVKREDDERAALREIAGQPPPEPDDEEARVDLPEPSDIWPHDAPAYCKVCHKTHGAKAGEKMCGGAGSWILE